MGCLNLHLVRPPSGDQIRASIPALTLRAMTMMDLAGQTNKILFVVKQDVSQPLNIITVRICF